MGARMFYQHCREGGLNITREETDFMRDAWIATFSEMQRHMQPKPIPPSDKIRRKYGFVPDDDDELEDPDQGRQLFIAHCIDGFTRNRASRNAALNVQFQALVAHGAKVAGWNILYRLGMGDRLLNFVHDEYLYWLLPEELETTIPLVEEAMLDGMRQVIPDVKIGVETSCSYHWDKGAPEFAALEKSADRLYLIRDPDIVADILKNHA